MLCCSSKQFYDRPEPYIFIILFQSCFNKFISLNVWFHLQSVHVKVTFQRISIIRVLWILSFLIDDSRVSEIVFEPTFANIPIFIHLYLGKIRVERLTLSKQAFANSLFLLVKDKSCSLLNLLLEDLKFNGLWFLALSA